MGEAARKRITVDEFLVWDGEGDRRYELIAGEIVAMTPPYPFHGMIAVNTSALLKAKLRPPCRAASEAGIRLPWRNDTYYQADIAVTCSSVIRGEWGLSNPVVIVEVLSPTTIDHDRGQKLADYRRIPSVEAIILIASDEKSVELWRRGEGAWTVVDLEASDRLRIDSIGFDIPVEALYDGLDLSAGATRG